MKLRLWCSLGVLAVIYMGQARPAPDLALYDWYEGTHATIEGTAFSESGRFYARLPASAQGKVPGPVWSMSAHSTGVNLRFVPDGSKLCFKWKVTDPDAVDAFMGPTAMTGLDVYRQEKDGTWKFAANPRMYYYNRETPGVYAMNWEPGRPCMVYLPLRSFVESFQIGVEKGTKITPLPPHGAARRIVHYGTSIVHGGCVSRPGMAFAAQEGRLADVEVVNLGFSGAGRMEMSMCEVLASIDAAVYILDCDWNMDVKMQQERYEPFVRELNRRRPQTPILLCGGCTQFDKPRAQEIFAKSVYDKLKKENPKQWTNLLFLSGVDMLPKEGEATFDFCHPNDWGSMQMGRVYAAAIQKALQLVPPSVSAVSKGRASETLERLRKLAQSKQFYWAWTEPWCTWGSLTDGTWPRYKTKIGQLTGRAPWMCYYDLATVSGSRAPKNYFDEHARVTIEAIRTHWRACQGIPVFSWHLDHPCTTNGFPQAWYRFKCKEHRNLIKDILDGTEYLCGLHCQWERTKNVPAKSPREWYFARLDQVVHFLNRLVDDNGDRIPVVIRYEHEMDGAWFWWGHTWCTPAEFIAFSRMTADYLREKCGRENLLFAYTPDRTWKELGTEGDGQHNFLSWYPGDAYVDVLGFDDYSIGKGKTAQQQEENFAETLRKLRLVSDFARQHNKVAGITETGCKDANDDFWTRLLKLATADGVDCAFVDTWSGPWTMPETAAQTADQKAFVNHPAVLTIPDSQFQQAVDID